MKKFIITAVISIVLSVVLSVVLVGNNQPDTQGVGASGSRFPNGLSADTTSPIAGQVRGTTLTVTGATTLGSTVSVAGLLTTNAGNLKSFTNATSVPASLVIVEADILNFDTILIAPTEAAADKAWTFPATSTITNMVPNAGDRQDTCFFNATGTAATTFSVVEGTGWFFKTASSTLSDLTTVAGGMSCFTFVRQTDTDISAGIVEFMDAN